MKPITSNSSAVGKYPRPERGSLCFHEDNPNVVIICTNLTALKTIGVIVHSPSSGDLGMTVEYNANGVKLLNGTITLQQVW
jgi:hypothetical protein